MLKINQKILVVDDKGMNRFMLGVMFHDGYEILEARNGLEAIEILAGVRKVDNNLDESMDSEFMLPEYELVQDVDEESKVVIYGAGKCGIPCSRQGGQAVIA